MDYRTEQVTVPYPMPLSRVIWKHFLRPMKGVLEATMEADASLSAQGVLLTANTVVTLVIPKEAEDNAANVPVLRLWGSSG